MSFLASENNSLQQLQTVCYEQRIPFVTYRLPLQKEITTLIQAKTKPQKVNNFSDITGKKGFIISPFNETKTSASFFLEPDYILSDQDIEKGLIEQLKNINTFHSSQAFNSKIQLTTTSNEYISNVNKAVDAMKNGAFNKVVVSKIRVEELPEEFNAINFFHRLCEKYPYAFVYLLQLPETGCWIGATPEPLMVVENGMVKTVSLAGTQIATGKNIEEYDWSPKEIEEQGIVTGFVETTLKNSGVQQLYKNGPVNSQAANLIHLKTEFEFPESELQNRLGEFLQALHPTPSVGGLPKKGAKEFILANEKHDRSYYTGFLGPVNIQEKTNIFVNLRCLQLQKDAYILYSGAGITASSVAQNEWIETDNKMMTMKNVIIPKGE